MKFTPNYSKLTQSSSQKKFNSTFISQKIANRRKQKRNEGMKKELSRMSCSGRLGNFSFLFQDHAFNLIKCVQMDVKLFNLKFLPLYWICCIILMSRKKVKGQLGLFRLKKFIQQFLCCSELLEWNELDFTSVFLCYAKILFEIFNLCRMIIWNIKQAIRMECLCFDKRKVF